MKILELISKNLKRLLPDIQKENWLVIFLLSIITGLYTLMCVIAIFLPDGIIEPEEAYIYILGWFLAPPVSILSIPFFLWVHSEFKKQLLDILPILLAVNSLALGLLVTSINLTWQITNSLSLISVLTYLSILIIPLTNLLLILILKLKFLVKKKYSNGLFTKTKIFISILTGFIICIIFKNILTTFIFGKDFGGRNFFYQSIIIVIYSMFFSFISFLFLHLFYSILNKEVLIFEQYMEKKYSFIRTLIFGQYLEKKYSFIRALTIIGTLGFINFIGLFPYFNGLYSTPVNIFIIALILGGLIGTHPFLLKLEKNNELNRGWIFYFDFLIIALIAVVCFDPAFTIDAHHQNFYLGPANRILHGGTMLVDTFSQYGNLSIYFLALALGNSILPFSYQGLSLLIAILFVGQFFIIYALLVQLVKNRFYAIILLMLSVLLGFFSTLGVIQAYASTGPYRFGLIYLLLAVILLRSRFPSFLRVGLLIEYGLIGVAFLWSFETFIYVGFSYLGICLFESFSEPVRFKVSLRRFSGRLIYFFLSLAITTGLFTLFTYARAKALPNWDIYLDYIKTYSSNGGFGTELIDAWSPWIFPVVISFTSLMIFLFRYLYLQYRKNTLEDKIILGLTLFGIAQYTYFLGRSHPNNLFHISIPAIIILGYWLLKIYQKNYFPKFMRTTSKVIFFSGAILIILVSWPSLTNKYYGNNTGLSILNNINTGLLDTGNIYKWLASEKALLVSGSQDPQVAEASQLIKKYMPDQKEIPIFLNISTEVLFTTNRIHSFPASNFAEDSISSINLQRIINSPSPLKNHDYLIIEKNPSSYSESIENKLQVQLLVKICRDFSFQEVESSSHGMSVVRLKPHDESSNQYCETINKLNE